MTPFELIPAIDLAQGHVVRLTRGEFGSETVYGDDPVRVAKDWLRAGAGRLHVVDLDGAKAGRPVQEAVVAEIAAAVDAPVQVGGGLRSIEACERLLGAGADRVVVGKPAITDEGFLRRALDGFGPRLVVALDARDREVRVAGWQEGTGLDVVETAVRLAAAGVARLLTTDIGRDGTLEGPDAGLFAEIARAAGIPILASGGVSSTGDLVALSRIDGVEGAIVGRALYTGAIDLAEALEAIG